MPRDDEPGPGVPPQPSRDEDRSALAKAMQQSQLGLNLVAPILGLGGIGWLLDRHFATSPWITLAGLILGVIGGMVNFIHAALHPPGEKE
jgi:F0F1-type ATP synthase assembly protein I